MPQDYGYAGEPRDGASGLVHLRARWYQPAQGRFLSRDPWAGDRQEPQTFAPYAYAHNDPANGTDPTGLWRWRGTSSPYHEAIEDGHLQRNSAFYANSIHAEYDDLYTRAGAIVDLLDSLTGDVYEIEPVNKFNAAVPQASSYVLRLRAYGIDSRTVRGLPPELNGRYTGYPKHSILGGFPYDWNRVSWRLGAPSRFPPMRLTVPPVTATKPMPWFKYADMVAMSPAPGAVIWWFEPKRPLWLPQWKAWKQSLPKQYQVYARQYLWEPGLPEAPEPGRVRVPEQGPFPTGPEPIPGVPVVPIPEGPIAPAPVPAPGPFLPSPRLVPLGLRVGGDASCGSSMLLQ